MISAFILIQYEYTMSINSQESRRLDIAPICSNAAAFLQKDTQFSLALK